MLLFPVAPVTDPTQSKSQSPPAPPRSNFPLLPRGGEGSGMRGPTGAMVNPSRLVHIVLVLSAAVLVLVLDFATSGNEQKQGSSKKFRASHWGKRKMRSVFGFRFSVFGFRFSSTSTSTSTSTKKQRRGSAICQVPPRNFPLRPRGGEGSGMRGPNRHHGQPAQRQLLLLHLTSCACLSSF